ncbi:MAG: serine O-acetyltransferase [Acidimicrobiales bacterium]
MTRQTTWIGNQNPPGRSLLELWREDFGAHDREFSPGFWAVAVHRFGNWRMSIGPKPLRLPLSLLYRFLNARIRNTYGIQLDYSTELGRRVVIDHQNGIVISGFCRIGDDCRLRQNVTMGIRSVGDAATGGAPVLGRGVDVGAGAVILGPITVGDGAVVGANAVVLRDVPPGSLAVGVPARIVGRDAPGPETPAGSVVANGDAEGAGHQAGPEHHP